MTQPVGANAPIRWREDGWELRCESCTRKAKSVRFWPLTAEFWDKRRMTMCRACIAEVHRASNRRRYATSAALRERQRQRNRSAWALVKSDPTALEIAREKAREATRRYRERQRAA